MPPPELRSPPPDRIAFADPEPEHCAPVRILGGLDHTVRYRVRPAPHRPTEQAAFAAASEARQRALARLGQRFGGFRFDLLQQNVDGNVASVLQVDPEWLDDFDGLAMVDRVMSWHDLPPPRLTFAGGGQMGHDGPPEGAVEPAAGPTAITRVRTAPLADRVRNGRTAIVNQIDQYDAGLAALCEDLERAVGTRVSVNCYVSYGTAEGFGAHWDGHDVIILQLAGSKFWELRGPDVLSPIDGYTPTHVNGEPVWSGVVRPGTAVYIPRGWGHRVNGFDELSVHLTIGMRRLAGRDVLDFVAAEALRDPGWRGDVPYGVLAGSGVGADALDVGAELSGVATDAVLDSAVGWWRAQIGPRPRGGFLGAADAVYGPSFDDVWIRAPLPGGVVFADPHEPRAGDPGGFGLAASGVIVRLVDAAAPVVTQLADGEPHQVADLDYSCDHPGGTCRDRFVRGLLEAGIAHVVDR